MTLAEWRAAPAEPAAAVLAEEGISPHLAQLLCRRGVVDAVGAERFLRPSTDQLHRPELLQGMEQAVARLMAARASTRPVVVVGDYDADGVSSSAILLAVFRACGLIAEPILPHRLTDGYGFQPQHVDRALALDAQMIVTVDCGTTSVPAVERALASGMEVVVVDHHLPGKGFPTAAVQINPKQPGCRYPYPELAAAGLALKLGVALAEACGRPIPLDALLRIACLGTIADVVPLRDENRTIAALGLAALSETRSVGLRALFRHARLRPPFLADDVGFRIGPRLNAAGRLGDAAPALELLLTRDPARANELAELLERSNRDRQEEEERVVDEAREALLSSAELPPILVAASESWHRGVVGIAAGRLARQLHRPTLLFSIEDGEAVGSGRSVESIHLHDFLSGWRSEMRRFGGHAKAIGMTVAADQLERLREGWIEAAKEAWPEELLRPRREYEMNLAAKELDRGLLDQIGALEPHGEGNPRPLARLGPLRLLAPPRLFGRGHLRAIAVGEDGGRVRLLGWRWGERATELTGSFEVLGYVETDRYTGGPRLRLEDCRPVG